MKDMLHEFGVSMGYQKAWRTREKALELSRGKPEDSYQQLPMYLHMLKKENPGIVTELITDKKNMFKYMFLALSNSIRGCIHCRPVIVVDGTFLKTTYGGTLFTTLTMDANNHILILAFGIGDSENDSSREWFFHKLRDIFGEREGMTIISDQHKSIKKAVATVYPNIFHGACIFHLLNNIKVNFGAHEEDLTLNFVKTTKTYNTKSFEGYMSELDKIDSRIRLYL
ncbi:PKS-NRPS hybrid synthetase cheA-like [Cannabis sativa]|uniref:PKS-NRPS hybrid synthetase cheA-like n=1 Tax=Cannabis sativa TaxID=3483 RepID=UPI0011DFBE15|nr:PKS-NRPS hybrid synthetase cheA-like [Cannabis sativa]